MHYAMLCLGNEALQSEEEFEKDEKENGVFTIPTGQGHRKPTIAGAALSGNNAGPGGAGGPCSAGVQRPENGTGHTAGEFALRHQSSRFIAAMHTYQTKYGWYKLRFAPNMNDVRMLLLDKLAVDSAHKLKQRAFRFHGLLLTALMLQNLSPALSSANTPSFEPLGMLQVKCMATYRLLLNITWR